MKINLCNKYEFHITSIQIINLLTNRYHNNVIDMSYSKTNLYHGIPLVYDTIQDVLGDQ